MTEELREDVIRRHTEFYEEWRRREAELPELTDEEVYERRARDNGGILVWWQPGEDFGRTDADADLAVTRKWVVEHPDKILLRAHHGGVDPRLMFTDEPIGSTPEHLAELVDRIDAELAARARRAEVLADLRARREAG